MKMGTKRTKRSQWQRRGTVSRGKITRWPPLGFLLLYTVKKEDQSTTDAGSGRRTVTLW